jgi:hypothetical protein
VDSDVYTAYADGTLDPATAMTAMTAYSFWDDAVIRPIG